ncbi:MAG: hypothetical protein R2911_28500 [Caldilineaceae bacterium]
MCITQPLNQVVDTDLPYLAQAVNVAFMGEFNSDPPNIKAVLCRGQLISAVAAALPQCGGGKYQAQ